MLQPGSPAILGWGAFSIFAVLAGLVLLTGADHAAPGCTGPEVQRCDYVETAKAALGDRSHFRPDLGFEVVDAGSSVRVQQVLPQGSSALFEGPAVLIDKKSCRACSVSVRGSTGGMTEASARRIPASGV
jgi:hypothetical protein